MEEAIGLICKIEEVLEKRKMVSARVLAKLLKAPLWQVNLVLNELEKAGIVEKAASTTCFCYSCPLSKICPYARTASGPARYFDDIYVYRGRRKLCKNTSSPPASG